MTLHIIFHVDYVILER